MALFPVQVTRWVISDGAWQPATPTVEIAPYTNATLFLLNGQVIDGRARALTHAEVEALRAKFGDQVVELPDGSFTLPFVPVGTIVDITPPATPAPSPVPKTETETRNKAKRKKSPTPAAS